MTGKLRVGEIRNANCTPIYSTLKLRCDCAGYEFVTGEPSELNALLAKGEIDVSASSSIEYARHWREYLIIPDISISSTGDVGSILLFSKRPMGALGGHKIAVSNASATSTVLLKALLKFSYGIEAGLVPERPRLSAMLSDCEAALLIGDEALMERKRLSGREGLLVYDLGGLWQEFTGLPFVYALWMVREDSALRLPDLAENFKKEVVLAKGDALSRLDDIAAAAPESAWMGAPALADYWRAMSYDLNPRHEAGLLRFYELAKELGEVPQVPPLRFI